MHQHPELVELLRKLQPVIVNEKFRVIDDSTLTRCLGQGLAARNVVLLMAALADAGVVVPKFAIRDNAGQLTDRRFRDLTEIPEYADDRYLNRFRVQAENIEPIYEIDR